MCSPCMCSPPCVFLRAQPVRALPVFATPVCTPPCILLQVCFPRVYSSVCSSRVYTPSCALSSMCTPGCVHFLLCVDKTPPCILSFAYALPIYALPVCTILWVCSPPYVLLHVCSPGVDSPSCIHSTVRTLLPPHSFSPALSCVYFYLCLVFLLCVHSPCVHSSMCTLFHCVHSSMYTFLHVYTPPCIHSSMYTLLHWLYNSPFFEFCVPSFIRLRIH